MTIKEVLNQSQEFCNNIDVKGCPICNGNSKITVNFDMVYSTEIRCNSCGLLLSSRVTTCSRFPVAEDAIEKIKQNAINLNSKWSKKSLN